MLYRLGDRLRDRLLIAGPGGMVDEVGDVVVVDDIIVVVVSGVVVTMTVVVSGVVDFVVGTVVRTYRGK